jgi:hypothetical protein
MKPVLIATVVFLLLWLPAAIFSRGFPEADGYTHYLCARFAFQIPANFLDMWGRPVCTALYSVPAALAGRMGAVTASALVAIGCAWTSFQIARDQEDRLPALAFVFTLAQPLLFLHSLSAMSELPFALLLGTAFLAFLRQRWGIFAVLCSLLPLARPEGFGFWLMGAAVLVWRGRARWLVVLPMPLLAWDITGWIVQHCPGPWWHWLISQWPWSSHSMYLPGDPFTFFAELPDVVSPLVLPATLLGIWRSVAIRKQFRAVTAAIPLFVLVAHTLLYATGKLGSYGEARYLLIAAPFWGVLSGRGWQWCFDRFQWRAPFRWAAAAVAAPVLINVFHPVVPLRPPPEWDMAARVAHWYARSDIRQRYPHLLCSHMGFFYDLDLSPSGAPNIDWNRENILSPPPGVLLIWDPLFGPKNANSDRAVSLEEVLRAGWIDEPAANTLLESSPGSNWHILHSPKP